VELGRYQILDTIGKGAYGSVVRGFDPLIGRHVAIKLLSPELAQRDGRKRFFQEARVVGQLSYPSIITLHDIGIDEATSTPYLVMEFLEGEPLDRLLDKGSIPLPRAAAWAAEVACALHAAHRRGVIHGDVKPANVFITHENRVKLMDFGMARLARHDTKDTPLAGTPAYWCPEQIVGRAQDARSDMFSLGVVLYEMVTGNLPFAADSLQGICHRVLSSTHLPASQQNPSVPTTFDDVLNLLLAKDPAARIGSGEELAQMLYPFARRKVVQVAPPPQASLRDRAARLLRSA
jgi:eukaryotic-like serine/threonine-protein kinase